MSLIKNIEQNHKLQSLLIQLSFILLSIVFVSGTFYVQRIPSSSDSVFNYQRLIEAFTQLMHLRLPQFSMNTTMPMGSAVMSFYPWLIFAPLAPLILIIHNPITLWCIVIAIGMLLGFEVSYYACLSLRDGKRVAYLFSIFYCFSTISILYATSNSDIGEYLGTLIAPLAFFGWIHWVKNNQWKMMAIGLSLISFCHILTFAITIVSLILLTLLFIDKIKWNKVKIISGLLSAISTILMSSVIWLPIFEIVRHNALVAPMSNLYYFNNISTVIPNSILFLQMPWMYRIWTFSDLATLILVIVYWKKLNSIYKRLSLFAVFYIILNVGPIKDFLIFDTPLNQIQFMYRICFMSHIILSFLLAIIIIKITLHRWYIQNVWTLILLLLALMLGSVYLSSASLSIMPKHPKISFNKITKMNTTTFRKTIKKQGYLGKTVLSNRVLKSDRFRYLGSNLDYLPMNKNRKWLYNLGYVNNDKPITISTQHKTGNVLDFDNSKPYKNIVLPIAIYHHQRYDIKLNGKNYKHHINSRNGFLEIHNSKKGINKLSITPKLMPYRYVSMFLLFIGLVMISTIKYKKGKSK